MTSSTKGVGSGGDCATAEPEPVMQTASVAIVVVKRRFMVMPREMACAEMNSELERQLASPALIHVNNPAAPPAIS
ncbi:MAG: hypothetical protein Q7T45_10580 [Bradyrhizobium sp.]|nr:hypothetical protein [Bradyrhizobium sp.]